MMQDVGCRMQDVGYTKYVVCQDLGCRPSDVGIDRIDGQTDEQTDEQTD